MYIYMYMYMIFFVFKSVKSLEGSGLGFAHFALSPFCPNHYDHCLAPVPYGCCCPYSVLVEVG